MNERTVVHLLRHGEVDNPTGVLYGRLPGFHLSADGRLMAQAAADYFADHDITVIYSSPMERAQETAEPVAEKLGLDIEIRPGLIEAANHFEGVKFGVGDGSLKHVRHWPYMLNPFRPSWGESYEVVAARMLSVVTEAREAARGHEAICVSHQLPIWIARRKAEGRRLWHDPRRRQCGLASVTSLHYEGDRLSRITYAQPAAAIVAKKGPQVPGA